MHRTLKLLALLPLAAATPLAAQQTIAVGGRETGELTSTDPQGGGAYYDEWRFPAQAGDTYVVTLRSDDFGTYLAAGYGDAVGCATCVRDDDGLYGTNSRLVLTAQVTGMHRIRVTSFQAGETGAYLLRVDSALLVPPLPETPGLEPPLDSVATEPAVYTEPDTTPSYAPAPADPQSGVVQSAGQTITAPAPDAGPPPRLLWAGARDTSWITPHHPREDGVLTEVWWFPGEAGQTATIEMRGGFRNSLRVLEETADRQPGRELARADGEGTSRVVLTLPRTGSYRVYAGGLDVGETEAYTLMLRH